MKEYINAFLADWLYQPHIFEKICHKTFLEEGPIVLNKAADQEYMQSPLFQQVLLLCETVRDAGKLKLTATGNLPLKVVQQLYKLNVLEPYFEKYPSRLRMEPDSITVHTARLIAEMGGLVKKRHNCFTLTLKGLKSLDNYHLLMETILVAYGYKLSWAYFDGFDNSQIGQYGFGLSLLLLAYYGDKERDSKFYSERYLYHNQRFELYEKAHRCYTVRTFRRFLLFMGLMNYKAVNDYMPDAYDIVSKTALFDKLLTVNRNFGKIEYSAKSGIPLYRLKIDLCNISPAIWREFIIPSDLTLENLHVVIQTVMGWTNSHLHQYIKDGTYYTVRYESDDYWDELGCVDYKGMKICDLLCNKGDIIQYLYDLGDSWMHSLELTDIIDSPSFDDPDNADFHYLECLAGERRCPPEDCGGIGGFYEILNILQNPSHEKYESYIVWLGKNYDPEQFDLNSVNKRLTSFLRV